jgi:hydroxymethylpyrimidine/phosphomethylpyrimidine kinase
MISAIRELIIPQSTLITPNSLEARRLAHDDEGEEEQLTLEICARRLLGSGCEYVLITGTHENTAQVINTLYHRDGALRSDAWQRLPQSYHGSGCTLASSITACIARGYDVPDAVREGQEYTWQTLSNGFRPGMGQFIPDRLFWAREEEEGGGE